MSKVYAVAKGHKRGLFDTWQECQKQINGYSGALYKSFKDRETAIGFLQLNNVSPDGEVVKIEIKETPIAAYVDGSFNPKTKAVGFGIAIYLNGEEKLTHSGTVDKGVGVAHRNVTGEIFGAVNAISWALKHNVKDMTICYDYKGLESWALGYWKANTSLSRKYAQYYNDNKDKINIIFKYVPAHTGIIGNERADILAKRGAGIC